MAKPNKKASPQSSKLAIPLCVYNTENVDNSSHITITISQKYDAHPPQRPYNKLVAWAIDEYDKGCRYLGIRAGFYRGNYHMKNYYPGKYILGTVKVLCDTVKFYNVYKKIIFTKYIYVGNKGDIDIPCINGWARYTCANDNSCYSHIYNTIERIAFDPYNYLDAGKTDASLFANLPYEILDMIIKNGKNNNESDELDWFHFRRLAMACPEQYRQIMLRYITHTNEPGHLVAVLEHDDNDIYYDDKYKFYGDYSCRDYYSDCDNKYYINCYNSLRYTFGMYFQIDCNLGLATSIINSYKMDRCACLWDLATGQKLLTIGKKCIATYIYNSHNKVNKTDKSKDCKTYKIHMCIRRFIKTHFKGINKERDWLIIISQLVDQRNSIDAYREHLKQELDKWTQNLQQNIMKDYNTEKQKLKDIKIYEKHVTQHMRKYLSEYKHTDQQWYKQLLQNKPTNQENITSINDVPREHYIMCDHISFIPIGRSARTGLYKLESCIGNIVTATHVIPLRQKSQVLNIIDILYPYVYDEHKSKYMFKHKKYLYGSATCVHISNMSDTKSLIYGRYPIHNDRLTKNYYCIEKCIKNGMGLIAHDVPI